MFDTPWRVFDTRLCVYWWVLDTRKAEIGTRPGGGGGVRQAARFLGASGSRRSAGYAPNPFGDKYHKMAPRKSKRLQERASEAPLHPYTPGPQAPNPARKPHPLALLLCGREWVAAQRRVSPCPYTQNPLLTRVIFHRANADAYTAKQWDIALFSNFNLPQE